MISKTSLTTTKLGGSIHFKCMISKTPLTTTKLGDIVHFNSVDYINPNYLKLDEKTLNTLKLLSVYVSGLGTAILNDNKEGAALISYSISEQILKLRKRFDSES